MKSLIDLTHSEFITLPYFDQNEAKTISGVNKGWSFSYVYNFTELRDVYLLLKQIGFNDIKTFTKHAKSFKLPYTRTEWNERRLLEQINALVNFNIITKLGEIKREVFNTSKIGDPLSNEDLIVFEQIYFSYFRFKELFSWFIDPEPNNKLEFILNLNKQEIIHNSKAIFCFSNKSRFTDSFIYELEDETPVYYINGLESKQADNHNNEDLMRFWDVFIKWGTSLGILEKFNLKNLDFRTLSNKQIACVYVIYDEIQRLDILDYIRNSDLGNYIYIPNLVFELCLRYRLKVETVHRLILGLYDTSKEYISFERTSEIFVKKQEIREGDKIFFPKYDDAYISHLILRT